MNKESEKWLETATTVKNESDGRGGLAKKAVTILSSQQVDDRQRELTDIEATLSPQNVAAKSLTPEGRQNLTRRRRQLENDLAYFAPPDQLDGETRDTLYAKQKELEEKIREGMPTDAEMWRNPVGVTDKQMRWHERTKFMQQAWKNLRRILNPHDRSIDLANVESLRPIAAMPRGAATFDANAPMPGNFAMTALAKDNWPESMPEYGEVNSPWKQAVEREKAELTAEIERLKGELTAKAQRKAALKKQRQEQMARAREASKAKRTFIPPLPPVED